jgi:hypothetical protein
MHLLINGLVDVDDENLEAIALYEHKVATRLEGHRGRPAWADDLLEAFGTRLEAFGTRMDLSNMQAAARLQNVHCVTNVYHIYPVPIVSTRNGVQAGGVPPGTRAIASYSTHVNFFVFSYAK